LFVMLTFILTVIEGIYKSSNLLFNCKDDALLLSLPIKKSTVLFIRIFKFYIFELLYNSLFLLPAIIVYAMRVNVEPTYYLVSAFALLLLPVIPIVISCILGGIISMFSSKFKFKNIAQIIITTFLLLITLFISFNLDSFMTNIAESAEKINNVITVIYYPAQAYIELITGFSFYKLLEFILVNIILMVLLIAFLGGIYYKINSKTKVVKNNSRNKDYKIKVNKPIISLIKKEFKKFISSPVFVTNAGFGLVLFVVGCVAIALNFDNIISEIATEEIPFSVEQIKSYIPVLLFGFICFGSLMTSITSSMISLEGKAFSILKSLPIKPYTVIWAKVLTAVFIMLPFILIGNFIMFFKFEFSFSQILMIIIASIVLPLISETIGILVNLKYPRMDAENDTQVVKQSMSSMVSVFTGMLLSGITIALLAMCLMNNISIDLILIGCICVYCIMYLGLLIYLNKNCERDFNMINV